MLIKKLEIKKKMMTTSQSKVIKHKKYRFNKKKLIIVKSKILTIYLP